MTPSARVAAAAGILDDILAGAPAERALTNWARGNRFAGSGDRNAIRDHVFDALRCLRSHTAHAGAASPSGRALMIGGIAAAGGDPDTVFTGDGYGPAPMTQAERDALAAAPGVGTWPEAVALDCPDWLVPALRGSLGPDFASVMVAMQRRAPAFLRVNAARAAREQAAEALAAEGIATTPHPLASLALEATVNARKVSGSSVYRDGLVELQDVSPQAAVEALPLRAGHRVLDYCAGGGGKTLAMAARCPGTYDAHDTDPSRMRDLPVRARRAGVDVSLRRDAELAPGGYDLVLLDVPCSGTGTWRRAPDARWTLTSERLAGLVTLQAAILDRAHGFVAPGGTLAYMTCSLLNAENGDQVADFLRRSPGWRLLHERRFTPLDGGDGFYSAHLTRATGP